MPVALRVAASFAKRGVLVLRTGLGVVLLGLQSIVEVRWTRLPYGVRKLERTDDELPTIERFVMWEERLCAPNRPHDGETISNSAIVANARYACATKCVNYKKDFET